MSINHDEVFCRKIRDVFSIFHMTTLIVLVNFEIIFKHCPLYTCLLKSFKNFIKYVCPVSAFDKRMRHADASVKAVLVTPHCSSFKSEQTGSLKRFTCILALTLSNELVT